MRCAAVPLTTIFRPRRQACRDAGDACMGFANAFKFGCKMCVRAFVRACVCASMRACVHNVLDFVYACVRVRAFAGSSACTRLRACQQLVPASRCLPVVRFTKLATNEETTAEGWRKVVCTRVCGVARGSEPNPGHRPCAACLLACLPARACARARRAGTRRPPPRQAVTSPRSAATQSCRREEEEELTLLE